MKPLSITFVLSLLGMLHRCGISNEKLSQLTQLPVHLLDELTDIDHEIYKNSDEIFDKLISAAKELRDSDRLFANELNAQLRAEIEENLNSLHNIDTKTKTN